MVNQKGINELMSTKQPKQRFEFENLSLDKNNKLPLFRQLEGQLRSAIWAGQLKPNERLPSSRRLAVQLNIARNTVINAYDQLIVEGFLIAQKGSGTRVVQHASLLNKPLEKRVKATKEISVSTASFTLSNRFYNAITCYEYKEKKQSTRPFIAHTPAYDEFPRKQWAQLIGKRLRQKNNEWIERTSSSGYYPLRQAISAYLGSARGMTTNANEIMITAGAQQAVNLIAALLIEPGDVVCFEEPAYMPAVAVFEMAGATIKFIPVDENGLCVDTLKKIVKKAKIIYTTPASHFPLGVTLSQERRHDLLVWAEKTETLIIEDDYNGEYRYRGRPLSTLYTMAQSKNIIYLGSFSKLLFPALRLGYMVVPKELMQPLAQLRWLLDRHSTPLEQMVLTDFINQGYFTRHLRRMRTLYVERQQHLAQLAQQYLQKHLTMPLLDGGLHLIAYLDSYLAESDFLQACIRAKVDVSSVSQFCTEKNQSKGIIFGYAAHTKPAMTYAIKKLQKELLTI